MESTGKRLRSRPSDPPELSPEILPAANSRARPVKRKRPETKRDQAPGRQKRTRGRSIPCRKTTDRNSSAATGIAGAQSDVATGAQGQELQGHQLQGHEQQGHSQPASNSETLIVNRDTLSELISLEVAKKISSLDPPVNTSSITNVPSLESNSGAILNGPVSQHAF